MIAIDLELRPASDTNRADFIAALNSAYQDYYVPIHLNDPSFEQLVEREDIRLDSSVAAVIDGQVIGMGMLGVRGERGWVGGMGVVPDRRHQGIGRKILARLIDGARQLGVRRLQLEVITKNENAYALYLDMGFRRVRHLAVLFTGDTARAIDARAPDGIAINREDGAALLDHLPALASTTPPWQHDHESMLVIAHRLHGVAARRVDGSLAGICLYSGQDDQGGVLALAAPSEKVGAALLAEVRRQLPLARLNYLNVPDNDPMLPVLLAHGFSEVIGQHEMVMSLG